jgi:hypothetical protein
MGGNGRGMECEGGGGLRGRTDGDENGQRYMIMSSVERWA